MARRALAKHTCRMSLAKGENGERSTTPLTQGLGEAISVFRRPPNTPARGAPTSPGAPRRPAPGERLTSSITHNTTVHETRFGRERTQFLGVIRFSKPFRGVFPTTLIYSVLRPLDCFPRTSPGVAMTVRKVGAHKIFRRVALCSQVRDYRVEQRGAFRRHAQAAASVLIDEPVRGKLFDLRAAQRSSAQCLVAGQVDTLAQS